ncbi:MULTISPECIES: hypothetical protein [unclassified Archaeoglobus]|jgi:hypothetical protein|uniref:hypothetical protein n=1 Tax=unclassified Archaeoglobus TaxID=2643606 RepID=UPI0025C40CF4|nr:MULTISPECIES: hypothetical protein [unclassified Archaeoglobus]
MLKIEYEIEKEDTKPQRKKFAVVEKTVKKGSENLSKKDIMVWIGIIVSDIINLTNQEFT